MDPFKQHNNACEMHSFILHSIKCKYYNLTGHWSKSNSVSEIDTAIKHHDPELIAMGLMP